MRNLKEHDSLICQNVPIARTIGKSKVYDSRSWLLDNRIDSYSNDIDVVNVLEDDGRAQKVFLSRLFDQRPKTSFSRVPGPLVPIAKVVLLDF